MKTIIVKIFDSQKMVAQTNVITKDGQPTVIKAGENVNYEFFDQSIGRGPNHIITKRFGDDLKISFDREGTESDLIIEGFYTNPNQSLIGAHESGEYYYYIPDTAQVSDYVTQLSVGNVQGQALGGESILSPLWVTLLPPASGLPWLPILGGIAGLGVVGAALGGGGDDAKPNNNSTPESSTPELADDKVPGETGKPVTVDVVGNDKNIDPKTVKLLDPNTNQPTDKVTVPNQGEWTVDPTTGKVTFTPKDGFKDDPTPVKYTAKDKDGSSAKEPATVTVDYPKTAPVTVIDKNETPEETPVSGNVLKNDTDEDGDKLTVKQFSIDTNGDGTPDKVFKPGETADIKNKDGKPVGTLVIKENGDYTFDPAKDFSGDVPAIEYVAKDEDGNEDPTKVILKVIPVEEPPVAKTDSAQTPKNTPVEIDILKNDSDPENNIAPSTVKLIDPNGQEVAELTVPNEGKYTVNPTTGKVTFTPADGYTGVTKPLNYIVKDEKGNKSNPAPIVVTVAEGKPPVAENNKNTTDQGKSVSGNVLTDESPEGKKDNDADGDTLKVTKFTVVGVEGEFTAGNEAIIPNVGKLTIAENGNYTFIPNNTYSGKIPQVTYTITDGKFTDNANLDITVDPVPVANDDTQSVSKDVPSIIDVLANDTHPTANEPLKIVKASVPESQGTVEIVDNKIKFTPKPDFSGKPQISYTVEDSNGDQDQAIVTLTLLDDKPPVAEDNKNSGKEDTPVTGNVITDKSPEGKIDSDEDGKVEGVTSFKTPDGKIHAAGETADVTDANGKKIGTIQVVEDGNYQFVPVANYNGTVPTIEYTIKDNKGLEDTAKLDITIESKPDAPIADDNEITITEGETKPIELTDPKDVDTALKDQTITVTSLPKKGVILKADGSPVKVGDVLKPEELTGLKYKAPTDYKKGDDLGSFKYDVKDDTNLTDTGEVTFKVEQLPELSITKNETVNEATGKVEYSVKLDKASSKPITVVVKTKDGSAVAGKDYEALATVVTFAPGETEKKVEVAVTEDIISDNNETYDVELSNPTGAVVSGTSAKVTTTIKDDGTGKVPTGKAPTDDTPKASVKDVTVIEGKDLVFDVVLSNPSDEVTPVTIKLTDGSAKLGEDTETPIQVSTDGGQTYTNVTPDANGNITVNVPAGSTNGIKVKVPTKDDTTAEPSEAINIAVNTTGQTPDTAKGNIDDNDGAPVVSIAESSTVNEAAGTVTYTIKLNKASSQEVAVNVATKDGNAKAGSDYDALTTKVTFAPGETEKKVTVTIKDDKVSDNNETYDVVLSNPTGGAALSGTANKVTTTIKDDGKGTMPTGGTPTDDTPKLTVANATAVEGSNLVHKVTLSNQSTKEETYPFKVENGSATSPSDFNPSSLTFTKGVTYNPTTGTITVPAGVTEFTVSYPTKDDLYAEGIETTKVTAGTDTATGTIKDESVNDSNNPLDKVFAKITVDKSSVAEGQPIKYTVSLVDKNGNEVTVPSGKSIDVSLNWGGTAKADDVTSTLPNKVTISGNSSKTIFTVTTKDDAIKENTESLVPSITGVTDTNNAFEAVKPHNTTNGATSNAISTTTNITDNDGTPKVIATTNQVVEATGKTVTGTVSITNPQSVDKVTINGVDVSNASASSPIVVKGTEGSLKVTGYNPTTGKVIYEYTEDGNAEQHNTSGTNVVDQFTVTGKDTAGGAITPGKLTVTIKDTQPVATNDTNTVTEDTGTPATGNIMTNDTVNADAPVTVTGITPTTAGTAQQAVSGNSNTIVGKYGTLTLKADGTYSYALDNNNAQVNALNDGQKLNDVFTYTIKDADGDTATATLNISVNGKTDNTPPDADNLQVTYQVNTDNYIYVSTRDGKVIKIDPDTGVKSTAYDDAINYSLQGVNAKFFSDIANYNGKIYAIDEYQLYVLNPADNTRTAITESYRERDVFGNNATKLVKLNALVAVGDGTAYVGSSNYGYMFKINLSDGKVLGNINLPGATSGDMVIIGNEIYMTVQYGSNLSTNSQDTLIKYNIDSGTTQVISQLPYGNVFGLATNNGKLYGVNGTTLYEINKDTGSMTVKQNNAFSSNAHGAAEGSSSSTYTTKTFSLADKVKDNEDADSALTVSFAKLPANGTLTLSNGTAVAAGTEYAANTTFTFKPSSSNSDTINYTVKDSGGKTKTATITLSADTANRSATADNDADQYLTGTDANDSIVAGKGNDFIIGGKGNDTLTGGAGKDTFVWKANDKGTTSSPDNDLVTDFTSDDKLNLSDLLQGETSSTLANYISYSETGGNVVLKINSTGGTPSSTHDVVITLKDAASSFTDLNDLSSQIIIG